MIEFEVTDGSGLIEVRLGGPLSMLRFGQPICVDWPVGDGSIDRYFVVLGHSEEYREAVDERVRSVTEQRRPEDEAWGSDLDEASVVERLQPLLQLFESGRYRLQIWPQLFDGAWDLADFYLFDEDGVFGESTVYWDGIDVHLLPTQAATLMDQDRVDHYEQLIRAGDRPLAILYGCSKYRFSKSRRRSKQERRTASSALFIIDGHHKLTAYRRLGIAPPVIFIDRILDAADDGSGFSASDLAELRGALPERYWKKFSKFL